MDEFLIENCKQMLEVIPEMSDFLYTGIPDTKLLTVLFDYLPGPDQQSFINETDHGKKLLSKIKSYQQQYSSVMQDLAQQSQQIRHQANTINILETLLDDVRKQNRISEKEKIDEPDFK